MSTDQSMIAIIVAEEEGSCIFQWDLKNNSERLMYDVPEMFKIIWDKEGQMYILNQ